MENQKYEILSGTSEITIWGCVDLICIIILHYSGPVKFSSRVQTDDLSTPGATSFIQNFSMVVDLAKPHCLVNLS